MVDVPGEQAVRSSQSNRNSVVRECVAEAIGTFFLLATIVGSGIMAENLAAGNTAVALLANSIAVGSILVVLILSFGPISGAHFNPAVTFAFLLKGEINFSRALIFIVVQVVAGIAGVVVAHLMFDMDPVTFGTHARTGTGNWIGEAVATFALVFTIFACVRFRPEAVPYAVGLVIVAGFWYTSSTSFANPAVTIARSFTDSFASIRPEDVPYFSALQFAFAAVAVGVSAWLFEDE